jgi:hypothetical protein
VSISSQYDRILRAFDRCAKRLKGYKVMRIEDGQLISGANSRLKIPARKGMIRMPGRGIYLSPNRKYVETYYSGLADEEVMLTLEFDSADITWGNLTDRESEVAVSKAKIVNIEPLD